MADAPSLREASDRLDLLLRELDTHGDPAVRRRTAEIVELMMTLHRAALDRLLELASNPAAGGPALVSQIADDPITGPILLAHDLHPYELDARVSRCLDRLRPHIAARGCRARLESLEAPAVHLGVDGMANLDADSAAALRQVIETALIDAAPELSSVVFDARPGKTPASPASPLIQIMRTAPAGPGAARPTT